MIKYFRGRIEHFRGKCFGGRGSGSKIKFLTYKIWDWVYSKYQSSSTRLEFYSGKCLDLFHGSHKFKSLAIWSAYDQLGFWTVFCSVWIICFSCLPCPTSKLWAKNIAKGKYRFFVIVSIITCRPLNYLLPLKLSWHSCSLLFCHQLVS